MTMWKELFTSDTYTTYALACYYLGALFWIIAYILIVRRIIREKFVELPLFAIVGNVSWEILWAFYFELSFGGTPLLYAWRFGMLLDVFMLVSVLRYGKIQFRTPLLIRNFRWLGVAGLLVLGLANFTYTKAGYDLPMGFNTGMILNLITSVACFQLAFNLPEQRFSVGVAVSRTVATDVFLFAYLLLTTPDAYFSVWLCIVCLVIDLLFITYIARRNSRLARS